jgi:hypothetical protein
MLLEWRDRVAATSWSTAYVYFKHDYIDGSGPLAVDRFVHMIGAAQPAVRASAAGLPAAARASVSVS